MEERNPGSLSTFLVNNLSTWAFSPVTSMFNFFLSYILKALPRGLGTISPNISNENEEVEDAQSTSQEHTSIGASLSSTHCQVDTQELNLTPPTSCHVIRIAVNQSKVLNAELVLGPGANPYGITCDPISKRTGIVIPSEPNSNLTKAAIMKQLKEYENGYLGNYSDEGIEAPNMDKSILYLIHSKSKQLHGAPMGTIVFPSTFAYQCVDNNNNNNNNNNNKNFI